jgi:hypothetical protein
MKRQKRLTLKLAPLLLLVASNCIKPSTLTSVFSEVEKWMWKSGSSDPFE